MGETHVRYKVVRVADKTDDQKSATEIINSLVSSGTQEDLQEFFLSQIKRIIHGNHPGTWRDDFVTRGIRSLEDIAIAESQEVTGVALLGVKDGTNKVFTTPQKFVYVVGGKSIRVYLNGIVQDPDEDFIVAESQGIGTGFDTVTLLRLKAPRSTDSLRADYYVLV